MANISIKEGGTAKQFGHINKLKISNSGGGTSLWVPEDVVKTKSLYVHKNGVYEASKDEDKPYGYDEVSVNITNECFGYDDDGNLWDVGVDDDDFLEEEEMPVRIEITTPPTKTSYIAYEPINTDGMVVTAYYGDDTEYGEIPREEYTIDPLVATVSGDAYEEIVDAPSELNLRLPIGIAPTPIDIKSGHVAKPSIPDGYWRRIETDDCKVAWKYDFHDLGTGYSNAIFSACFASANPDAKCSYVDVYNASAPPPPSWQSLGNSYTYDGKTVYWTTIGQGGTTWSPVEVTPTTPNNGDKMDVDYKRLAWAMIYGTSEIHGTSSITVKWNRPEDEEELTDEFEITVTNPPIPPVSGDDSGGGGSSGDSW